MADRPEGPWPGDTLRDPDGTRYTVQARMVSGGERSVFLLDEHGCVSLMPLDVVRETYTQGPTHG